MKNPTKKARAKTPKNFWKTSGYIVALLIWVGAVVIVAQIVVSVIMYLILGAETFIQPVPTAIFSAISYILATIVIIFVPPIVNKRLQPTSREKLGLKNLPTWVDIGLAPVGFVAYTLLAALFTALFSLFPWFDLEQAQDVGFSLYISGFDRVIAFITLVIIAPFFEEVIFRGWLYDKFRTKLNQSYTNTISIIVSSLLVSFLFGFVHLQWNVGVNVFAMSIVLCTMREITGTIYSGIFLHMLKNGIAFYLVYILGA